MMRLLVCTTLTVVAMASSANVNPAGGTRQFDGVGGLSGGGATSRLFVSYKDPQRSKLLDLLFSKEGAALDILKVEIGGDAQSTDGSESSHMHTKDETPNFHRGYEWWLMQEAKKRNPDVKLYGLPWAFPKWVSGTHDPNNNTPYTALPLLVNYTVTWVAGARDVYGLTIDKVGSWNERAFNADYLIMLRKGLDDAGLQSTEIIAADRGWDIADAIVANKTLAEAVHTIGVHYPGSQSTPAAIQTGKPLWASEDDSTFDDLRGAACWAKITNRNFVEGNMTSTIMWNLVGSYYQGLPWFGTSFFTAATPWSGHWDDRNQNIGGIYVAAHTTHFTEVGWTYLAVGQGSGMLDSGGSYVALVDDPTAASPELTIVIEKMTYSHGFCIRPNRPYYNTSAETATFTLDSKWADVKTLRFYKSQFGWDGDTQVNSTWFERQTDITVGADGSFTVDVAVDALITITTLPPAPFMDLPDNPADTPFPVPYSDDFDSYNVSSEAFGFADQAGVWEIQDSDATHGKVMAQMVPEKPICWSGDHAPYSVIGDVKWSDMDVSVDVLIPKTAGGRAFLGGHTRHCCTPAGLYMTLDATSQRYVLSTDFSTATGPDASSSSPGWIGGGQADVSFDTWYTLRLVIKGDKATGYKDGQPLFEEATVPVSTGWPTIGTGNDADASFHAGLFDNFKIASVDTLSCPAPKAGVALSTVWCGAPNTANSHWDFDLDHSTVSLVSDSSLCMSLASSGPSVQPCNASDPNQQLSLVPINGKPSHTLKSASGCLISPSAEPGEPTPVHCGGIVSMVEACDGDSGEQHISFSSTTGHITSSDGLCLSGACGDKTNGCAPASFKACSATDKTQMWTHSSAGAFVNTANGMCLDAWSGTGPSVGVYGCHTADNQRWTVSGASIKSGVSGGKCLAATSSDNGAGNGFWLSEFGAGDLAPYGPQNTAYCTAACGL